MAKAKKTLKDLKDLASVQEELEEEELAEFPEDLLDRVNGGIQLGVVEISGMLDELEERMGRRKRAYLARGQIFNAQKLALEDETKPLGQLTALKDKLKDRLTNTMVEAGIKIPVSPYGSPERELLAEIERRITAEKVRIGDIVAKDYGFENAKEVFDICNAEQALYDKDNKSTNKKGR